MEIKQHNLNNPWVKGKVSRLFLKCIQVNENKSTDIKMWVAAKAVVRGNFLRLKIYSRKEENSRIDNVRPHLSKIEKEQQQQNPKARRKIYIKIRTKNNFNWKRKTTKQEDCSKQEAWRRKTKQNKKFIYGKVNKIDKPL